MTDSQQKRKALSALVTSALALPGLANLAKAEVAPKEFKVGVRYTGYEEGDLKAEDSNSGKSSERYSIDVAQIHLQWPLNDQLVLYVDFVQDTMSGATPLYVNDDDGEAKVVMSSASIEDTRQDVAFKTTYYHSKGTFAGSFAISDEDDYQSMAGGLDVTLDVNEKHTKLAMGIGVSADKITPTPDTADEFRRTDDRKGSFSVYGGVTQVINRYTSLETGLSFNFKSGYLSDPYKTVCCNLPVVRGSETVAGTIHENRPSDRASVVWVMRYRQFLLGSAAAIHTDYRFYTDNWDLNSHTLNLAWYQNLKNDWQLVPGLRYYSQSSASFYSPFYSEAREDGIYSSDYRLSPYGALSFSLTVNKKIDQWNLTSTLEHYQADADFGLKDVEVANPGLVSFNRLTMGFDYSF